MKKVDWYGTLNLWGHLSRQTKHRSQKGPSASEYERTWSLSLKVQLHLFVMIIWMQYVKFEIFITWNVWQMYGYYGI